MMRVEENSRPIGQPSDRAMIVVGRRKAGKTVFLARLYEALWDGALLKEGLLVGPDGGASRTRPVRMSCRATDGPTHMLMMRLVDELHQGKFPAATSGQSQLRFLVSLDRTEHPVVTLDYPGEVFRQAFLEASHDSQARDLRSIVESAAGAILLIDPETVFSGILDMQEDAFGQMEAVVRMRKAAGGDAKPVAVVFTKYDRNRALIRDAGGAVEFARRHFPRLVEAIGTEGAAFASYAVQTDTDSLGRTVPSVRRPSYNVVQPFHYCLATIAGRSVPPSAT